MFFRVCAEWASIPIFEAIVAAQTFSLRLFCTLRCMAKSYWLQEVIQLFSCFPAYVFAKSTAEPANDWLLEVAVQAFGLEGIVPSHYDHTIVNYTLAWFKIVVSKSDQHVMHVLRCTHWRPCHVVHLWRFRDHNSNELQITKLRCRFPSASCKCCCWQTHTECRGGFMLIHKAITNTSPAIPGKSTSVQAPPAITCFWEIKIKEWLKTSQSQCWEALLTVGSAVSSSSAVFLLATSHHPPLSISYNYTLPLLENFTPKSIGLDGCYRNICGCCFLVQFNRKEEAFSENQLKTACFFIA